MTFLKSKAKAAHESKGTVRLLVYVYYAGHGIMYGGSTKTQIVFNEERESDRYKNHQNTLQNISDKYENIFIIAVFDCCRNRLDKPKVIDHAHTRGDSGEEE